MRWMTFVLAAGFLVAAVIGCSENKDNKKVVHLEPKDGSSVVVTLPDSQTFKLGEAKEVKVKIERKGFDDDVGVHFDGLPKGVTVDKPDQKIEKGKTERGYVLIVASDAPDVEKKKVTVTCSAKDAKGTGSFDVTVKSK